MPSRDSALGSRSPAGSDDLVLTWDFRSVTRLVRRLAHLKVLSVSLVLRKLGARINCRDPPRPSFRLAFRRADGLGLGTRFSLFAVGG